jgi:hypothetical protein
VHQEKAYECDVCAAAKQHKLPHPPSESRAENTCQFLRTDLMCPSQAGLLTEDKGYVLTVLDDHSRYSEVSILSTKAAVPAAFLAIVRRMERQTGNKVKGVRFDRGKEYYQLKDWMMEEGIVPQPVPAYTPEANGRAERLNRTLVERTRAMLHQFNLPLSLWQHAMRVASYTRNMVPSVSVDITPYQLFFRVPPSVSHLRTFGCFARVLIPSTHRGKFDRVNEEGMFVGYAPYSQAWQVLVDTESGLVIRESHDVSFDESRTCSPICQILTEHPDCDVRPAEGSHYAEVILPTLKRPAVDVPEPQMIQQIFWVEMIQIFCPKMNSLHRTFRTLWLLFKKNQ